MPDTDRSIDPTLIDALLATPHPERRAALLRAAGLLDADSLAALLDSAAELVRDDPARGGELAAICADLAGAIGAAAIVPRAAYIRARVHAINAEYDTALRLIDEARGGYAALGRDLDALRTGVGRMVVLKEIGRYGDALDSGRMLLDALDRAAVDPDDVQMLTAMVQQNRGLCFEQMGQYDEALDAYAIAEQCYRALDMPEQIGEIGNNRGIVLLGLGRGSEALQMFDRAAATFEAADLTLLRGEALLNGGNAHLLLGQYVRALDLFEQARRQLDPLDAQADKHVLLLDTAAAYLALNLYPEALAAYREAEALLATADMPHDRARALWGTGSALLALGQPGEAAQALDQAALLFAAAGNVPMHASVLLERAALLDRRGERAGALSVAQRALELVADNDWPVQRIYAHLRLADLRLPDLAAAESHLRAARRLSGSVAMPHLRYRLDQRLGHLRALQHRDREAESLLLRAIDGIEQLRGTLAHEALRVSFLRDKATPYEDLVRLYVARGDAGNVARAFEIAERAKSRALVDLLSGADRRSGAATDESAAQLHTLQADLHAVYDEMLSGMTGQRRLIDQAELRARAADLEHEISRLRLRAAAAATGDSLGTPLAIGEIMRHLPPDTALVAFHGVGDALVAFVAARGELRALGPFGSMAQVQAQLQRLDLQWDRVRAGSALMEAHAAVLAKATQRVLQALYAEIWQPIAPLLDEIAPQRVAIVPHGPLHRVPFHALTAADDALIDRYEIVYAPSATVLALCRQRDRRRGPALVIGVPDPSIPAVASEVSAVAGQLADARICLDDDATIARLRADAPHSAVLHLACHGVFRDDNPLFSALKLHDGWLTAGDALDLDLDGALVMLSACESARGQSHGSDEIVGLARAFVGAGATTLIASLWLAHDRTTADLAAALYRHLRASDRPAAALRAAQRAARQQQPHPYFWAPFMVIGGW